jgi:hypothetical protein
MIMTWALLPLPIFLGGQQQRRRRRQLFPPPNPLISIKGNVSIFLLLLVRREQGDENENDPITTTETV